MNAVGPKSHSPSYQQSASAGLAIYTKDCVRCVSRSRNTEQARGTSEAHIPFGTSNKTECQSELSYVSTTATTNTNTTQIKLEAGTPRSALYLGTGDMSPQKQRAEITNANNAKKCKNVKKAKKQK